MHRLVLDELVVQPGDDRIPADGRRGDQVAQRHPTRDAVGIAQLTEQVGVLLPLELELLAARLQPAGAPRLARPRARGPRLPGAKRAQRLTGVREQRIVELELGLDELTASLGLLLRRLGVARLEHLRHAVGHLLSPLGISRGERDVDHVRVLTLPNRQASGQATGHALTAEHVQGSVFAGRGLRDRDPDAVQLDRRAIGGVTLRGPPLHAHYLPCEPQLERIPLHFRGEINVPHQRHGESSCPDPQDRHVVHHRAGGRAAAEHFHLRHHRVRGQQRDVRARAVDQPARQRAPRVDEANHGRGTVQKRLGVS